MKRLALLWLALACASCGVGASQNPQPESLAMAESSVADGSARPDVMVFEISGERLQLDAGICNTNEDGTFRFALAEGPLGDDGRVTATIERFESGVDQEIVIVIEGTRDDGTELSWYARSSLPVHDITIALFASALEGSAIFESERSDERGGQTAPGTFAIRCNDISSEPLQP